MKCPLILRAVLAARRRDRRKNRLKRRAGLPPLPRPHRSITKLFLLLPHVINRAATAKGNKTGLCSLSIEEITERINDLCSGAYKTDTVKREIALQKALGILEETEPERYRLTAAMATPPDDGVNWPYLLLPGRALTHPDMSGEAVLVVALVIFRLVLIKAGKVPWRWWNWTAEQMAKELFIGVDGVRGALDLATKLKFLKIDHPRNKYNRRINMHLNWKDAEQQEKQEKTPGRITQVTRTDNPSKTVKSHYSQGFWWS